MGPPQNPVRTAATRLSARAGTIRRTNWSRRSPSWLSTDGAAFPSTVHAFGGNRAETTIMAPVLRAFLDAYRLSDVAVIADAAMASEANQGAIERAGLSLIPAPRRVLRRRGVVVCSPGAKIPDEHVFAQLWPRRPGLCCRIRFRWVRAWSRRGRFEPHRFHDVLIMA